MSLGCLWRKPLAGRWNVRHRVAGNLESLDPASTMEVPLELVLPQNRTADAQSLEERQALLPVPDAL